MRKKRTSNALKGIASCMICAWSLCACGNVAEDSSCLLYTSDAADD